MMTAPIRVEAPAKVNLYLHVTGRRADGYHLLESLVAFAGIGDSLTFAPAPNLSLTVEGPGAPLLPLGEDNIVLAAARALARQAGVTKGAAIRLVKRLPVAAGIGGGSADAAAALRGLAALWRLGVDEAALARIGLSLGADVPVCLGGRPTLMTGIGERLAPAPPLPPAWLVLVNPRIPLSTPAVFKARAGAFTPADPLDAFPPDAAALAEALARRRNDLAEAAITLLPDIARALDLIQSRPGCLLARMSGSGATTFGLFATEAEARAAESTLTAAAPTWWIAAAPLLA